jgi:hypothetical protein
MRPIVYVRTIQSFFVSLMLSVGLSNLASTAFPSIPALALVLEPQMVFSFVLMLGPMGLYFGSRIVQLHMSRLRNDFARDWDTAARWDTAERKEERRSWIFSPSPSWDKSKR